MTCSHRATQRKGAVVVVRSGTRYLRTICPSCRSVVDGLPEAQRDGSLIVRKWTSSEHLIKTPEIDFGDA